MEGCILLGLLSGSGHQGEAKGMVAASTQVGVVTHGTLSSIS